MSDESPYETWDRVEEMLKVGVCIYCGEDVPPGWRTNKGLVCDYCMTPEGVGELI